MSQTAQPPHPGLDDEGHVKRIITIDIPADNKHLIMYGKDLRGPTSNLSLFFPARLWSVCITPPKAGSPQYLFAADAFRIFKMSLDGHVIGWLGGEGKSLKELAGSMASPARTRTRFSRPSW